MVAGGLESISLVQNEHMNVYEGKDPWLEEHKPEIFMSMLETAEVVASRYGVCREVQDEYSLESQRRTAAAQEAGRFDAEIVPISTTKRVVDRDTGAVSFEERHADRRRVQPSGDDARGPRALGSGDRWRDRDGRKRQPAF